MTKEEILAFHVGMTGWLYDIYRTSWTHKAALDNTEQVADAEQYDIQQGWPDNKFK